TKSPFVLNKKPPAHRWVFLRYLGHAKWKKGILHPLARACGSRKFQLVEDSLRMRVCLRSRQSSDPSRQGQRRNPPHQASKKAPGLDIKKLGRQLALTVLETRYERAVPHSRRRRL